VLHLGQSIPRFIEAFAAFSAKVVAFAMRFSFALN
jgi:hypothetical protein